MARISGVDLPREKRVEAGLQYIYGIGPHRAGIVLQSTNINPDTRVRDLTEEQVSALQNAIQASFKVEGDLRRETTLNIKRLMDINCYRGQRHRNGRRRIPLVLASRMDIGVDLAAHHGHRLHTR